MTSLSVCLFIILAFSSLCASKEKCTKPPEQKKCHIELVVARKDFCKQLPRLRTCFMDEAGCSSDFFYNIKRQTEDSLNIKCHSSGPATVAPSVVLVPLFLVAFYCAER